MSKGKGNNTPPAFERFLGATYKPRCTRGHVPSRSDDEPSDYNLNVRRTVKRVPLWVSIVRVLCFVGVVFGLPMGLATLNNPTLNKSALPIVVGALSMMLIVLVVAVVTSESEWEKDGRGRPEKEDADDE